MEMCEFELYKYMLVEREDDCKVMCDVMRGDNKCYYKGFQINVPACRMSGEMSTSLGNGFTNLMAMLFLIDEKGGNVTGVVEGDDGLFVTDVSVSAEDFHDLGFDIKIVKNDTYTEASFCGIVASKDGFPLTDPRKVLLNFGWSHSFSISGKFSTRMGLLRAKALSLLHEHPCCPVLTKFALHYITLTAGFKPIWSQNWYERQLESEVIKFSSVIREMVLTPVSQVVRQQFADLFDIPVEEQLAFESKIPSFGLSEITDPIVDRWFRGPEFDDCRDYYVRYVGNVDDLVYRRVQHCR